MGIDDTLAGEIVERMLRVATPKRIILFGSAATDTMTSDSDIDLLVLEEEPQSVLDETMRLRQSLRGLGYPFDIVVMDVTRFEETKDVIGGIAYPAQKYGKVLYEAA